MKIGLLSFEGADLDVRYFAEGCFLDERSDLIRIGEHHDMADALNDDDAFRLAPPATSLMTRPAADLTTVTTSAASLATPRNLSAAATVRYLIEFNIIFRY
jgi:hypothetical protein